MILINNFYVKFNLIYLKYNDSRGVNYGRIDANE